MNIISKTRRNTFIFIFSVMVFTTVATYFFLKYQFNEKLNSRVDETYKHAAHFFVKDLQNEKEKLSLELENILSIDGLSAAVAAKNHKKIDSIVASRYIKLKNRYKDINIFTFRSKENITIYRAHKPNFYGDSLNKKRKLILDTARLKISLSGFEVGKFALTYRVTEPIFYKNRYVGNVELGLNPTYFLKELKDVMQIQTAIAIDKSLLDVMLQSKALSINDKYAFLKGSDKLRQYFIKHNDSLRVKMDIPLKNHLSETIGYLIVGVDSSNIVKRTNYLMTELIIAFVIAMLLLAIILHKGFGIMLEYFKRQAYTDALTGLGNRQLLKESISNTKNSIMVLSNIKDFSLLNEIYGVNEGNQILKEVAEEFKKFAQEFNFNVYRISSDEYVLFKEEDYQRSKDDYCALVDELTKRVNGLNITINGFEESINIEIYSGIVLHGGNPLEDAHMALRKARMKFLPYIVYSEAHDSKKRSEEILNMKHKIHYALEYKNVVPFFQPITNKDGKVVKYEALVRILDFEKGEVKILSPFFFLDIAIKGGLYFDIAKEVLRQSLKLFKDKKEKISVNFLPNDFYNESMIEIFLELIKDYEKKDQIVVEVTEQEGMEDFNKFAQVIQEFRKVGVLIAIDDFGSGYANYQHILMLKPDYIKIDGSLVENVVRDKDSQILIKSIIDFASELNITVVAEYVENKEIFDLLKEYGVDEFQGYYFGKPENLLNK
ncbi:EAL domain-containing protein [Sulfurimonas autotrophica]|uniref:Diguanylate cyclase/phosphodiesterase n=1 Tax=Sulfurimonas autotrophica (strain ATCC BAA-671 / DSM 16294 / JCM 11897 / OK10) TaxID=563040 RepID=E0UQL3_SULAO|nr:EAL domain-containing protein [Sulfurimonas autotrophica]ADN09885.1 diguanylate cyclase/phosphodiesterase [Sulfurimonas autotrophica DSM 16294]